MQSLISDLIKEKLKLVDKHDIMGDSFVQNLPIYRSENLSENGSTVFVSEYDITDLHPCFISNFINVWGKNFFFRLSPEFLSDPGITIEHLKREIEISIQKKTRPDLVDSMRDALNSAQ